MYIAARLAVFSNVDITTDLGAFRARLDRVLICVLITLLLMAGPLFVRRLGQLLLWQAALFQTKMVVIRAINLNCSYFFYTRR